MTEHEAYSLIRTILRSLCQEYPHKPDMLLRGSEDLKLPREVHPSFYGCYDWHSAVHSTWTLVCLSNRFGWTEATDKVLANVLRPENLAAELCYLQESGHTAFERPYGIAWMLKLSAEADTLLPDRYRSSVDLLRSICRLCEERLASYFLSLETPVRGGAHGNTAFSMTLALQAGKAAEWCAYSQQIRDYAFRLFRGIAPAQTGGSSDFLDPELCEGVLLSMLLSADELCAWAANRVQDWCSAIGNTGEFLCDDPSTCHSLGLSLNRAWCLGEIASRLPQGDPNRIRMVDAARASQAAALVGYVPGDFLWDHWIPTFILLADGSLTNASG